ncbi:hypothetical protein J7L13_01265 [bacterium]|nr:hypothetical protein [bacterium]
MRWHPKIYDEEGKRVPVEYECPLCGWRGRYKDLKRRKAKVGARWIFRRFCPNCGAEIERAREKERRNGK